MKRWWRELVWTLDAHKPRYTGWPGTIMSVIVRILFIFSIIGLVVSPP